MSFSVEQTSSCTLQRAGPALSRKFKRTGFSHTASHYRPSTHDSLFAPYLSPIWSQQKKADAILRSPKWMLSTRQLSVEIKEIPKNAALAKSNTHQDCDWPRMIQNPLWIRVNRKSHLDQNRGKQCGILSMGAHYPKDRHKASMHCLPDGGGGQRPWRADPSLRKFSLQALQRNS